MYIYIYIYIDTHVHIHTHTTYTSALQPQCPRGKPNLSISIIPTKID